MRYIRLGRGRTGVLLVLMLLVSLLAPMSAQAAPARSNEGDTQWVQVYTVQRGDTLAEIAWDFGVSEDALMRANSIRNPNLIYVGQQLIIPEKQSHGTGGPQCDSYYTVRRGDTLSQIALDHGIDEYALARANGVYDLNDIYVGQKLCIPGNGSDHSSDYDNDHGGNNNQNNSQPEPQRQPEYHNEQPQGSYQDGPKQDGPQNDGPKQDAPQRPPDEGQPHDYDGPPCNPCDGPNNEGQHSNQDGPSCNPCDGPQHPDGANPQYDDPHKQNQLRPTEYWKGTYFNDKYFSEFVIERQDLEVNFNWLIGSPFSNMNQDRFSVRWEKVEFFKEGPYRFYAIADDGVRVYVDDQLIIDGWVIQPATEYKADINLSEGPHKLVVEYYEEAEDAQIRVYWEQRRHHN